MRHLKVIGLCLLAALAIGAVAASAAQAEGPEWGHCVKLAKNKGKYKDANCQELEGKTNGKGEFKAKAKGAYEWVPGGSTTCYAEPAKKGKYKDAACTELEGKTNGKGEFKPKEKGGFEKIGGGKFTSHGGKGILTATPGDCDATGPSPNPCPEANPGHAAAGYATASVECNEENGSGEATGTDSVANVHVTFTGCKYLDKTEPCENEGAPEGQITVNELVGELGYLEKASHKVGVVLHPAAGPSAQFVKFICGAEYEVNGKGEKVLIEGLVLNVGTGSPTEGYAFDWTQVEAPGVVTEPGHDGIISPIVPVNEMTSKFKQQYTQTGGIETFFDKNTPARFEGGPLEMLETRLGDIESEEVEEEVESKCIRRNVKNECVEWERETIAHENEHWFWGPSGESITNENTTTEGSAEIKA